jgi:hypothetical protein
VETAMLSLDKKVEGICLARYATYGDFDLPSEEEQRDNNWYTFINPLMYWFLHKYFRIAEENNKRLTEEYLRKSKQVVDIIGVAFTTTWGSERIKQLNDLGFEWWLHDEYWEQCLVSTLMLFKLCLVLFASQSCCTTIHRAS